jgi:protein O-GlcNAc transferase
MPERGESDTPELRLLLACAKPATTREDESAIRRILVDGIDWALLARMATDQGLAVLAGRSLNNVAPDMVPSDILDAFHAIVDQTPQGNFAPFDELTGVMEALASNHVEAIVFKAPVLATQLYGDLGLGMVRDLHFLIRDPDIAPTIATLRCLGYERREQLTAAQFDLIHVLQGREVVFKQGTGTIVVPHSRLTPIKMVLDIDYEGLWRRAQRTTLNGRAMLTAAPEDHLLILAIDGGKEMWRHIRSACDFAAFIGSRPNLDWSAVVERARAQGCLRMLLLATSLARKYCGSTIPDAVVAAERADPIMGPMVDRIMTQWQAGEPTELPGNNTLSVHRLRLHDGIVRQARYVARTLFLPAPAYVAAMPLPKRMRFAYVPLKIAHDLVALPLWRARRPVLAQAARLQDALAGSDLALALMPASAETKRHRRARAVAKCSLAADPTDTVAWLTLGDALSGLKHYKQAISCYDKVLACVPESRPIWMKRRAALRAIRKNDGFPDLARNPRDANAWALRAGAFSFWGRYAEASEASERALSIDPSHLTAARIGIWSRLYACDWRQRENDKRRITAGLRAGVGIITPFDHLRMCDSKEENLIVARLMARGIPPCTQLVCRGEHYRHDKIRIAYISTDFHAHATAFLIAGVFEHHDRTSYETTAISLGPNDGSEMRRRLEAAFHYFVDAREISDAEVAAMLRNAEIDIAVDLNGYMGVARRGIFAQRPSPLQVNYLGYPGTTASPVIDYIIADHAVIPEEHQIYYSEKVAYLPHTYQPNDSKRRIAEDAPTRAEAGLPEMGFVFTCFNNTNKIGPEMFEIWMRLLQIVENSVLWLLEDNMSASSNLRREARTRGISPERLVFAQRQPAAQHLARQRLADLFLDTLPHNAHTTASDALWAGLPVLTCMGNTFAGRVAASLLHAIGLPGLVTSSLAEYEEVALALAHDPDRLAAIKAKLIRNQGTEPLFDTARYTRDLEAAYRAMWERQQAGLPPSTFAVASAL